MATKRADLAERKRCLDAVLPRGHRAQYWDAVERFLRAKSTKAELEAAARSLLGSEATHYQLHNEFFLVLLHNAQCPELPRAPVESGAVELAKGKRHAPLDDLIKQSSAKRRHGGADAGGKVSKSSATAAAAAAALAKRNLGAVGAASFLSRLPRRLRYLAASHLPMSSLGPITIFSNSKEDVLAALPAYMFAAPRFHAYDRALPMYSLPLRIRAPQLCVSASSLAVHYSANQMQSASPTKPDPTDTCDVAGEGVDSSAPRLCSSQSLLAAWFSSMNRAGIANELPDSAQIRSRMLECAPQSVTSVSSAASEIVAVGLEAFLKKMLSAAQSSAASRRLGHAQPASRFALPRHLLAQPRLNSASRNASGRPLLLKHEAVSSAAVAHVEAAGTSTAMESSPRSGGRLDLSRDLFSFLSSDPVQGGFPPPSAASALLLPCASPAPQSASRFSEVFPEMSSVLSHASSHSSAPFESKAAVQVGNREVIQDRRDGNEEEFDSDDEESMMDWSLMPRENGAGRLEEDAWKRANGVRRILATDVLAAIQAQPELLAGTLSYAVEKLVLAVES